MSISSRITEMEQHIGNAYDKIEDLGIDLTNVDKNINNISSMLENVWNEYPKVTETDVEKATLNGTKKGRMNIDLKGNTYQEQLTGKNLFDVSTIAIGKALNLVDGSLQDASDRNTSDFIEVQPSETYICNKLINRYVEYDENKQLIHTGTNVNSTPITMKTNAKYFRFSYASDVINIQFEKNSTPTSYEPYCGGIPAPNPRLRMPY